MLQLNILTAEDHTPDTAVESWYRWSISALNKVNVHRESLHEYLSEIAQQFWFDITLGLGLLLLLDYVKGYKWTVIIQNFSRFHSQGWKNSTLPTIQHRTTVLITATTPLATISWRLRNTKNSGSSRMWWHAWSFLSPFPWSSWPSIICFLWYVH